MNKLLNPSALSAQQQAALYDEARRRAVQARAEAIADAWIAIASALKRLQHRLLRHVGGTRRPVRVCTGSRAHGV